MKTCKDCRTKKSESDFTKGKAVCKKCRSKNQNEINKADRIQRKCGKYKNEREEFYKTIILTRKKSLPYSR